MHVSNANPSKLRVNKVFSDPRGISGLLDICDMTRAGAVLKQVHSSAVEETSEKTFWFEILCRQKECNLSRPLRGGEKKMTELSFLSL